MKHLLSTACALLALGALMPAFAAPPPASAPKPAVQAAPPVVKAPPPVAKQFANASWANRSVRGTVKSQDVLAIKQKATPARTEAPKLDRVKLVELKGRPNAGGHALTPREMANKVKVPGNKNSLTVSTSPNTQTRYDLKGRGHKVVTTHGMKNVATPHLVKGVRHAHPTDPTKVSWRQKQPGPSIAPYPHHMSKADVRTARRAAAKAAPRKVK